MCPKKVPEVGDAGATSGAAVAARNVQETEAALKDH